MLSYFGFSGPRVNCPGFEDDPNVPCADYQSVANRSDIYLANPESTDWCYQVCGQADFAFGLSIPQFIWIIATVNIISLPAYFLLHEEKRAPEKAKVVLNTFWKALKKKAVWMLVLYTMVSSITFNVYALSG